MVIIPMWKSKKSCSKDLPKNGIQNNAGKNMNFTQQNSDLTVYCWNVDSVWVVPVGHAHCLVTKRGWGHHHHHQHHHHPVITIIIIITIIAIIITVSGQAWPSSSSNYPLFLNGPLHEILNCNLTVLKNGDAEPKKWLIQRKGHYRNAPLKNGLTKMPCCLKILVSWGDFFDIGLLLYPVQDHTMQCCNRKPFWVAEPEIVVLHRPFLILRLLQNIV